MDTQPRITFGIIVLNGEPFTRYNLRAIYPFAHQIIVVEGASPKSTHAATPDGHSIDGTLEVLRRFKAEEDPEDKLLIVTAEDDGHPNGFWPGEKDQQSQAYARRATGDWLWQVDIDEFYHPGDIQRVRDHLATNPSTTCLTFSANHFWGGFNYKVEGGLFMSRKFQGEPWGAYRRVFKWGPGYQYVTHRPPTIADAEGHDITRRKLRRADKIWAHQPMRMYHYLMIFPEQYTRKGAYYQKQAWNWDRKRLQQNEERLREVNLQNGTLIYDHHGTHNWLARFRGIHPEQVQAMQRDIASGKLQVALRHTDDIEQLLTNPHYRHQVNRHTRREKLRAVWQHALYQVYYGPRARLGQLIRSNQPKTASVTNKTGPSSKELQA